MIIAAQPQQKLTFEEFLEQCPSEGRYEFVDGEIVRVLATRKHDTVAEFLSDTFKDESKRSSLNYWVSGRVTVATLSRDGRQQGRNPDVSVVDRTVWDASPTAYSALLDPIQLAVEVVSTNWEDDYIDKLDEYQRFGIAEYWIVDYLAIGSREYLGNPKEPSVFVYAPNAEGAYQYARFQGTDRILSPTFPALNLTVEQILKA
ncbi:Uma2 family endonuclease [Altericista sp. CCNU0014]|uniref:Uma2 family endonuclease n=1 Tax=Altericista sp. CCNU0014 TaxID=3082949 RepID=UPI003850A76D